MSRLKRIRDFVFSEKKKTDDEIQALIDMYERKTAKISKEKAIDLMDSKQFDFLLLLRIAEYAELGKSKSILFAFRLGYLAGLEASENRQVNLDE